MANPPADTQRLRFGIFDWIDRAHATVLADQYEERLRMLEYAEEAGFWCYHLAEHHGTPLSMTPSPNLFIAAAAQRTRRIRLGPLVALLPLYSPIRVIEEVCMLDHLTKGRLELGVGRGVVPSELAQYNVRGEESRAIFLEALEILVQGLRDGHVAFEGHHYSFPNGIIPLRPHQRPYPPLWYPTSNPSSVEWIAGHGFNTMFGFTLPTLEQTQRELGRYREYLAAHQGDSGRLNGHVQQPIIGLARHLYVADTDTAAEEEARPAYSQFRENFLSRPPATGEMPAAIQAMQRENWPEFVEQGGIFVGAPETVRRSLQHYIDTLGVDYVVGVFAFGNLRIERILESMRLFVEQVAPNLRPAARPASAARSGS